MRKMAGPLALIMQLGAIVLAATLFPLIIGLWLDSRWHTTPWLTLVALLVGIASAVTAVYFVISTIYKELG